MNLMPYCIRIVSSIGTKFSNVSALRFLSASTTASFSFEMSNYPLVVVTLVKRLLFQEKEYKN